MPEDALVNTSAVQRPHLDPAHCAVREHAAKLHRWAGDESIPRRFANAVTFTGASSVTVNRCRYRGNQIHAADPRTGSPRYGRLTSGQGTWSARCGESRTPGAGRRPRETGRW
jgi:hypothetical protein